MGKGFSTLALMFFFLATAWAGDREGLGKRDQVGDQTTGSVFFPLVTSLQDGRVEAFRSRLLDMGFAVQNGKVDFPPILDWCCQCQIPTCYANNAASPYGIFVLPPAPDQPASVKNPYTEWFFGAGHYPEGWSWFWRMRPDEAIVFIGKTPPEMAYFGFTGYLYDRFQSPIVPPPCTSEGNPSKNPPPSAVNRLPLFASLGDTVNNQTVKVAGDPTNPFQKDVIFILVSDQSIERQMRTALLEAGFPEDTVNTFVFPGNLAHLGVQSEGDTLTFIIRMALPKKLEELNAYTKSQSTLLRVSPQPPLAPAALSPLTAEPLRVKGTGDTEIGLLGAVDLLGQAIVTRYPQYDAVKIETENWLEGYNCIENGRNCLGDNRDTPYIPPAFNPLTGETLQDTRLPEGSFYVVYGVNHQATGKATYSNVSVMGWAHKASQAEFISNQMPESARYYLGSSIDAETVDKLYAWKIVRPGGCGDHPPAYCMAIGTDCRTGIGMDESVAPVFRAYLEAKTMVGPAYGELIIDRILKFTPKP